MPRAKADRTGIKSPTPDPLAERIRELRRARRLTLAELAKAATRLLTVKPASGSRTRRSASVSASYVSLIENGYKVPDEPIAVALAEALGDDPRLYRAWVHTRKRADLETAIAAAEILRTVVDVRGPGTGRRPTPAALERKAGAPTEASSARLRVPVIPEGLDPGEGVRPSCDVIEWRRLDPARLPAAYRDRLVRPFAWRPTPDGARRVRPILTLGTHALVLRDLGRRSAHDVYAVRHGGRVVLSRVLWNGRLLLLLPAEGESDFVILEAGDESRLRSLILGVAIMVRFDPEEPPA